MKIIKVYTSLLLMVVFAVSTAQNTDHLSLFQSGSQKIVVMQPTGEIINDFPEMIVISDTTLLQQRVDEIVSNSYVKYILDLYYLAETYNKNTTNKTSVEPAYLAITENKGGFARVGFFLKTDSGQIDKSNVPYIDITESRIDGNYNRLMSITQLYPHEMGHLIYGMLYNNGYHGGKSVTMHYFSVITDYATAFNEGFAEHFENISRIFEENDSISKGISEDTEKIIARSHIAINGFEKDFLYPFRLGYYKITMPIWYQKYENLKRYKHAITGDIKYLNATLELTDIRDRITIRNSGVRYKDGELRNYVQMLSTEGVINSFFTKLTQSDLKDRYQDPSFYKYFLQDTTAIFEPKEVFNPIQNQFVKYFTVFRNYMDTENKSESVFIDFVEGYISAFPDEEATIKNIFKETTGLDYTQDLPPQLWLIVKDFRHRMLVPDPYGALTIPVYTFDLNAAEFEDLLTIEDLSEEDALRIIDHRNENGFYNSLNQISEIEGISIESVELILSSEYDDKYMDEVSMPKLDFMALIYTPLKYLIIRILVYFIFIFGAIYIFFLRKQKLAIKRILSISIIYLLQWILFVLGGLIFVILLSYSWILVIAMSTLFILLNIVVYRKNNVKRKRSVFATIVMGVIILISVI